jgi:hypothetical protein
LVSGLKHVRNAIANQTLSNSALEPAGVRRRVVSGSRVWHAIALQRSVREWAMRQGWGGRPVDHKAAAGILIAALGVLAAHLGYGAAKRAS